MAVSNSEVVIISFLRNVRNYFFIEALLESKPLQGDEAGILLIPPNLLPGAVFRPRCIQSFARKMMDKSISEIYTKVVFNEVSERRTKKKLEGSVDEIVGHPVVNI